MALLGTLPVTNNPDETYNITIIDAVYSIRQLYNTLGFWTLSVFDENEDAIVEGIKVVAGILFLTQYAELPFNFQIQNDIEPTRDNFSSLVIEVYSK